ncbi:nitrous oxide reductase family maturation protein NosD [Dyella silvae]|uniref:nitrous oxide reductase family maturation protein NosD n=1 Tax=Dyella silvae TaxID=2994424 RepID=UPI002263CD1C|nr:nitrous oxide reductase family maturation protein NosD [Dyella silvae]
MRRLAAVLLLGMAAFSAGAATLQVHPGDRIDVAIAQASAGDTIELQRGTYVGSLRIDKPLALVGIGRPTISGDGQGDVIRVASPDVRIEGVIVRDSGDDLGAQNAGIYIQPGSDRAVVRHCDFAHVLFGLWIEKSNQVRVEDNLITGMREKLSSQRGNAIQLYNTDGATIARNHISFARDGIYVDVSHHARFIENRIHDVRYGTHYMNSYHNLWEGNESFHNLGGLALMEVRDIEVRNNVAWGNASHGIMLRTIQDSTFTGNVSAGNGVGLFVYDAEYVALRNNLVVGNAVGVHLWAGSYNNEVDGNDFIGNTEQVSYVATRDVQWGKREGNYWSNYLGWDADADGYGDVPFEANELTDRLVSRYPFVKLLDSSPAMQALGLAARQFPVLRVATIFDAHPAMRPHHADWSKWLERSGR